MITCLQRARVYDKELKRCLVKLLVDKFLTKLGLQHWYVPLLVLREWRGKERQ